MKDSQRPSTIRMSKNDWKTVPQIASSEITPEAVWLNRRNLMKSAAAGASMTAVGETIAQPKALKDPQFYNGGRRYTFQSHRGPNALRGGKQPTTTSMSLGPTNRTRRVTRMR